MSDGQNWWGFWWGETVENFCPSISLSLHFMLINADCHRYLSFLEENSVNFNVTGNYGFCVVLFYIVSGSEPLLLGNTLGTLLESVSFLFSL